MVRSRPAVPVARRQLGAMRVGRARWALPQVLLVLVWQAAPEVGWGATPVAGAAVARPQAMGLGVVVGVVVAMALAVAVAVAVAVAP